MEIFYIISVGTVIHDPHSIVEKRARPAHEKHQEKRNFVVYIVSSHNWRSLWHSWMDGWMDGVCFNAHSC